MKWMKMNMDRAVWHVIETFEKIPKWAVIVIVWSWNNARIFVIPPKFL
jgi:hypothetical protein